MSEPYVGEARVRIIPDARDFGTELNRQVQAGSRATGRGNAGVQALLKDIERLKQQNLDLGRAEVAAERQMARTTGTTLKGAAAFGALGIATRNLVGSFGQWASAQDNVYHGLGQIANGIANLDLVSLGQGIGETAARIGGAGDDLAQATAQEQRLAEQQRINQLVSDYLDLREKAAKAEGQIGTAAGRVKYQLEQQLRIAQAALLNANPQQVRIGFSAQGIRAGAQQSLLNNPTIQKPQGPTDADYQIKVLQARLSKETTDDLQLYRARSSFLRGLISRIEKSGADSASAKANLQRLYGQLLSTQDQINSIEQQAAAARQAALQRSINLQQADLQIGEINARTDQQRISALQAESDFSTKLAQDKRLDVETRKQYEVQAAQYNAQIIGIQQSIAAAQKAKEDEEKRLAEEEKKRNEEKLARQRDAARQLRELRLSNAEAKAQLTQSTADDKRAIRASIAYWKERVKELTGLEREQARTELISAHSRLKGLGSAGGGATVADFYREVLSDFRQYGSNFSTSSGGVLSPQQARGQFAALAIGNTSTKQLEQAQKQEQARLQRLQAQEAQKQTKYLAQIAGAVTGTGGGLGGAALRGTTSKIPSVATSVAYGLGGAYINGS